MGRPLSRLIATVLMPPLVALALLAAGCGGDAGDPASPEPSPAPPNATPAGTEGRTAALPGGELLPCESPDGFVISRPEAWEVNTGEVVSECTRFDPESFELEASTDERFAAITAHIDRVPFVRAVAPRGDRDAERAVTVLDGLQAVRLRYEADSTSLWPRGTPVSLYAVDLSPGPGGDDDEGRTLFLDTVGLTGFDYETNEVVLDRMARTLEVTLDGVPEDDGVVARYGGGGSPFTVVAEMRGEDACLRVPPDGEWGCVDAPPADGIALVGISDLRPLVAGVTGDRVQAVTAQTARGEPSTFLPAPIPDSELRGFAFDLRPERVERLVSKDLTGEQLGALEP